jgi:hypothetical protein
MVRTFRRFNHAWAALLALGALVLGAGCASPVADPVRSGPFYVPSNVTGDPTLGGIRRVVLMPVWTGNNAPEEIASSLDPIFRQALQDQNRFEIVTLSREECRRRFGRESISSASALPHELVPTLRRVFAADAVMFVDITVYRAYHPLALGIRGRLAVLNNLKQVWAFDNVFSADDPLVAAGARHFFLKSDHQDVPGDLTPAVLQSPSRLAAYAAATTFETLPPVTLGRFDQTSAR